MNPTLARALIMDDKTLNLWRQIESCRRNNRSTVRTKPGALPARRTSS